MSNNKKMGRPTLGITKKVSVTLKDEIWKELDKQSGDLPLSAYLRKIITQYHERHTK